MQPATTMGAPQYQQQQQQQQQQQWMMMMNQQQQAHQQQPGPGPPQQFQSQPPSSATYYYQQQQQQQPPQATLQQQQFAAAAAAAQPGSADEIRTLWIGDLQFWMDEQYINSCFAHTGEVVSAKVIRNRQTGQSEGYGFIEFASHAAAERHLQSYNGTQMPNVEQNFRLNWASFGGGEKRQDDTPEYTIFVGDLAPDVTDYLLQETFRPHYPSLKGAKVVNDRATGRSKGYGFVKFSDESEQLRAMSEMNGRLCSSRAMRIGPAANKKAVDGQQPKASYQSSGQGSQNEDDPNNTTIFVGGLDTSITEENLRQVFGQHGQIVHVKIPVGKRCGFVQFAERSCAEEAIQMLNGTQLGGQSVRLSWGRNPSNKQTQVDANQWNGGYYGVQPGYETYGYGQPPQDPNIYYGGGGGGYPGYGGGGYPQQQQHQPHH